MEKSSPRFQHQDNRNHPHPPPPSQQYSSSSSTSSNYNHHHHHHAPPPPSPTPPPHSPRPIARSDSINPYPTTFVQADTSSFKLVVQMLTGSPKPAAPSSQPDSTHLHPKSHSHSIPPIKSIPIKRNQSSSSGFKLYERRNSLKNLKINPLNPFLAGSTRKQPEILSPSILDFPALVLSPVTPLIPDPFDRSGSGFSSSPMSGGATPAGNVMETEEEEKAIKERGFYLHRSPATTPREAEPPRLLPLFPVTSPRVSAGSANASA
ncbi:VQ motif-containing protein 4 [Linum perenne]